MMTCGKARRLQPALQALHDFGILQDSTVIATDGDHRNGGIAHYQQADRGL